MAIDISGLQAFSASDLLALVEHAIAQVLAGNQSVSIGGQSYTRADLDKLFTMRTKLKAEVAESTDGGSLVQVQFVDPA
jgi:hypothetical protein